MDDVVTANSAVLFLFLYLLPGFLGLVVYGFLVEGESQDRFDKLVTAFVLSLLSNLCVHGLFGDPFVPALTVSEAMPTGAVLQSLIDRHLLHASVAAALIGAVAAWLNNRGLVYDVLKALGLSYKMSNTDVWQNMIYRHRRAWLRLEMQDGRTLVGYPRYFSATGKPRELFMSDATWSWTDNHGTLNSLEVKGAGVYISDFTAIKNIEVMK